MLIEKRGFRSWGRSGVEVGKDECGVNTRRLEAELEPIDRSSEEISQQLPPRHNTECELSMYTYAPIRPRRDDRPVVPTTREELYSTEVADLDDHRGSVHRF